METLVVIILVIIMIIYDSNLVETFKKKIEILVIQPIMN